MMITKARDVMIFGLVLVACSRSEDAAPRDPGTETAASATAAPEHDMASLGGAEDSAAAPMAGMDHAQMAMPARSEPATEPDRAPPMVMDHSAMPGMMPAAEPGAPELLELVAELVKDPVVLRAIEADPALREAWADTAVRRIIVAPR